MSFSNLYKMYDAVKSQKEFSDYENDIKTNMKILNTNPFF